MYCINSESVGNADKENAVLWLKSLRPQPNQEWSEEDKNMLQSILDEYKSMPTEKRYWLKSLKYRYTWKPSDEQIYELSKAVDYYTSHGFPNRIMCELFEQLKKL
jgi:hypothetical protein